jgi:hypothetical protein
MIHFEKARFQGSSGKRAKTLESFPVPAWIKAALPKGDKHKYLMKLLAISFDSKQWDTVVELQGKLKDVNSMEAGAAKAAAAESNAEINQQVQVIFAAVLSEAMAKMMALENSLNMHEGKTDPGSRSKKTLIGLGGRMCTFLGKPDGQSKYGSQLELSKASTESQTSLGSFFSIARAGLEKAKNTLSPRKKACARPTNPYNTNNNK